MWKDIKLILKSVREYKALAILTPILMVGEAFVECLLPYVMTKLVGCLNETITMDNPELWKWIIVGISLVLISIACGFGAGVTAAKASTGFAANLRGDLYKKIESFSFSNIDKFSAASLVTRMTTDIQNVQMAFQMCTRILIRAPLLFIFSIIMGFVTGGLAAFVFVVIIPIIVVAAIILIRTMIPTFRKLFKRYDKLNESVEENVSGIRVVKSFVREKYEQDKFNLASDSLANDFIRIEKITALTIPIVNTCVHLSNFGIIMISSYFIAKTVKLPDTDPNKFKPETMSALFTYGISCLTSLLMVAVIMVMLVMSIESTRRISEVLREESTIKNCDNPIMEVKNGNVVFKDVNFKYFDKAEEYSISGINLEIKSGEFVGIIGSTGSGKTTIVNLISRLYDVTDGSIFVSDNDVKNYDLKTLRDNVAVVLQKNLLFSGTIEENLRWGNENATKEEIQQACYIAQASEFINGFKDGLETKISQGGTNVSGGQKQRLCIARAILKKPKILILDDSTSAVDTKTDKLIRDGLKEVIPETTKIVIAQRISSVESADKIIVLDNGKINQIGDHKTLLKTNKIYQEVYNSQNKENGGSK